MIRIINERHFSRLEALTEKTDADLVIGGARDPKDRFMDMHVYTNVNPNDPLMGDEIFGPILPIVRVDSHEEAIAFINSKVSRLQGFVCPIKLETRNAACFRYIELPKIKFLKMKSNKLYTIGFPNRKSH